MIRIPTRAFPESTGERFFVLICKTYVISINITTLFPNPKTNLHQVSNGFRQWGMPRYLIYNITLMRYHEPRVFHGGSDGKAPACNVGYPDLILGLGRSPREGNVNPLQYSCLKISMDRGACQAAVHGVTKSLTWLSDFTFLFYEPRWH